MNQKTFWQIEDVWHASLLLEFPKVQYQQSPGQIVTQMELDLRALLGPCQYCSLLTDLSRVLSAVVGSEVFIFKCFLDPLLFSFLVHPVSQLSVKYF